ncbi:hypothetical protein C8R44DRAFT_740181 [Mycena epipterygia]|nr:hypothetical protein C8R44DRAFT_740181 [Mycena epipterygia]
MAIKCSLIKFRDHSQPLGNRNTSVALLYDVALPGFRCVGKPELLRDIRIAFLAAVVALHSNATLLHQNNAATHFDWIFGVPASGGTRILPAAYNQQTSNISVPSRKNEQCDFQFGGMISCWRGGVRADVVNHGVKCDGGRFNIKLDETIAVSGSNPLQRNYQGPCPLVLSKPSKLGLTLANRQRLTMLNGKRSGQTYLGNQDFAQSHVGGASPILTAVPLTDPFLDKIKEDVRGHAQAIIQSVYTETVKHINFVYRHIASVMGSQYFGIVSSPFGPQPTSGGSLADIPRSSVRPHSICRINHLHVTEDDKYELNGLRHPTSAGNPRVHTS